MLKNINCIGLACPGPVIAIKKALDSSFQGVLEIVVDNVPARENSIRFLKSQGQEVDEIMVADDVITLIATIGESSLSESAVSEREGVSESSATTKAKGVTYVINSEVMGRGEETLGKKLLIGFLNNLPEIDPIPETIFFYNSGINFALEGAPTLEAIRTLESHGTEILVCGTCTNFHDVTDKVGVGVLGNLFDLTNLYQRDRVICL